MRKFILAGLILAMAVLGFGGTYSGGAGTEGDPYQISSVADWAELVATTGDWDTYLIVTADINFAGAAGIGRVGTPETVFSGSFDGDGHTLSNGTLSSTPDSANGVGLFGRVIGGVIKDLNASNLTVVGTSPNSNSAYVAIIAAELQAGASMTGCTVSNCTLQITHTQGSTNAGYIGALCGICNHDMSNCSVSNCTISGTISAGAGLRIGGAVGSFRGNNTDEVGTVSGITVSNTTVSSLDALSAVEVDIGGLCGEPSKGASNFISNISDAHCYNVTINFTGASKIHAGGLVGDLKGGTLDLCSASGTVTVTTTSTTAYDMKVGGLAGYNDSSDTSTVTNSHSTCTISATSAGSSYIGGIFGYNVKSNGFSNCYYKGTINTYGTAAGITYLGGIGGAMYTSTNIDSCYADVVLNISYGDSTYAGGAFGWLRTSDVVSNCYAKGTVYNCKSGSPSTVLTATNKFFFGGFVGYSDAATCQYCWAAIGPWSVADTYKHGFRGYNANTTTYTDCYWDTDVAGFATDDQNAVEATTEELKTLSTFAATGFDFTGDGQKWKMLAVYEADTATDTKSSYPKLLWETYSFSGGAGTAGSPYKIKSTLDWNWAYENTDVRTEEAYFINYRDLTVIGTPIFMTIQKVPVVNYRSRYGN